MLKITTKLWDDTPSDYKLIKDNTKYIMLSACCLQPCEIDNQTGLRKVDITLNNDNEYYNDLRLFGEANFTRVIYDPTKTIIENLKDLLKRFLYTDEMFIYYLIKNNKLTNENFTIHDIY